MIKLKTDKFLEWLEETYPYIDKFLLRGLTQREQKVNRDKLKVLIKKKFPKVLFVKEQRDLDVGLWNNNIKLEIKNLIYTKKGNEMLIAIVGIYNEDREIFEDELFIYGIE